MEKLNPFILFNPDKGKQVEVDDPEDYLLSPGHEQTRDRKDSSAQRRKSIGNSTPSSSGFKTQKKERNSF